MNLKKIKEEEIAGLHFLSIDVLNNEEQKINRTQKLFTGMIMGNIEHEECLISFHSEEGDNCIESIIFAVTDRYVCLKGGITLLIASIIDVIV